MVGLLIVGQLINSGCSVSGLVGLLINSGLLIVVLLKIVSLLIVGLLINSIVGLLKIDMLIVGLLRYSGSADSGPANK